MGAKGLLPCLLLTSVLSLSNTGLVQDTAQQRQEAPSPPVHNVTLQSTANPKVFNHIYNINIPASALCSTDQATAENSHPDPKDGAVSSSHHSTEHTIDAENQIVFTHHINIPRQACGCTGDLPGLKDIMSRLEMLEGEVSALRSQCSGVREFCSAQVTDGVGVQSYCHGHGNFSSETYSCICEPGWRGANCTEPACPGDCNNHGLCVDGKCQCFKGFAGEDCTLQVCLVDCGQHGRCVDGLCVCAQGFSGETCSDVTCLNNCQGRGRCVAGQCVCDKPWTGADCSQVLCPKDCHHRGQCVNGTCFCEAGYAGEDCGQRLCPSNCHGNGLCVAGRCVCTAGYHGDDCSKATCLNDCSGRGTCFNGICICDIGYQDEDCSQLACPNNCNSRGQCINGLCACDAGFQGDDCSELSCPNSCFSRGRCVKGQCVCEQGFAGEDCRIRTCPSDCHGRGECIEGRCTCYAGFSGEDCSELSCPNNCLNQGRCVDGQCVCHEGFTGDDCSRRACRNDCVGRGICVDGVCACQEGYLGDDCSVASCPDNCSDRGRCVDGRCACAEGFEGRSCEKISCLNNCQDRGQCENGRCVCDEGFVGEDCSEVSPPKDLTVGEVTAKSVGLSWDNGMLVTEYLVTYVPTKPGGLHQEFVVPGDKTAAIVKELEPGIEYFINVYAVLSNKRSVPVSARVATHLPQAQGLLFKSVRETSVEVMWDQLDINFDGWEIFFRNTKEENGKVVSTLPSSQNQFTQSGLGPGQEYEVSLRMIKNNTRGPLISQKVTTKIDGPQQVEVKDVTDSTARVTWSLPVALVDGITLAYGPKLNPEDRASVEISSLDSQYSVGNLTPDTEYQVSLTSRRGDIVSDSVNNTFTTELDAPKNVQAVSQTDSSITLEWTNSQANVSNYRVKYTPISGGSHGEEVFSRGPGQTMHTTIKGLRPGTEYGIGVTAVKEERESLPTMANAATDMDPPRDLQINDTTETTLALSWQKPQAKVTGYKLVYVSEDGLSQQVQVPPQVTSYILANLQPRTAYRVSLVAKQGPRRSAPVTASASTATLTFYLANPDAPEQATPTGSEDSVVSVVYLDPPDPLLPSEGHADELGTMTISGQTADGFSLSWKLGAPPIYDSLIIDCRDTQRTWNKTEVQLQGNATGHIIRGLNASTEYQITLYGISSSQRSALLEAVAVTASETPTPDVTMTGIKDAPSVTSLTLDTGSNQTPEPTRPLNTESPTISDTIAESADDRSDDSGRSIFEELTVTNVTSRGFSLVWAAPDSAYDSFLVELGAPPTQNRTTTLPGGVRRAEVGGLAPSTNYNITLQGLVRGEVTLSLKAFATTAEELTPTVANLTASDITWDSFNVSWSPVGGEFDSFVIEVTNLENVVESQNLSLSGDALSLAISGLNPGSSYMVAVYGMHQGGFTEPVYIEATTVSEPVVGKLYVSNLTSESFSIFWNATEEMFDGYILEIIDSDWLREPAEYNISNLVRSHDVTGLRPSTDYIAYLYGKYRGSRTHAVSIVATTAAEPELSRLIVSNITSDRFYLSWRTGEKAFDNFIVEVRESALPSQAMGRTLAGEVRSTVMAGLKAKTSYDIKLYASSNGQSTPPLFAVATTEDVPQLGPIAASSVTPNNLTLSWSTVSGHFDGFILRVSDSEQQFDAQEFRVPPDGRNITVSNLMDATGYDIELYGISHGRHTPSMLAHATTAPLPKVENLTVSNVSPYGFRVSWEVKQQQEGFAPSSGGFSHFHVVVTDSGWLLEPQEFTVPGNQSHLDMWGLITGIGYEVRLTGVSESGLLSRPLTAVAVTEAEPEVEHLFISDITPDSFRLSWTADEDLFDRFVIKVRDSKKLFHPRELSVRGDERTKVLSGLVGGTEYDIELYGVTLDGRSQAITGVAQTGLGAPSELHFSDVTENEAVVHWARPGYAVDNFRVTYVPYEGGSPMVVTVDGGVFETVLPNMSPGRTYQVRVSAVKGLEESDPSTNTVTTALDRPQGLAAINVTDTSAILLWQPSVATVDGYGIMYMADSGDAVTEHVSGNTVEFEMSSLQPATRYTVGVHAVKDSQRSVSARTEFITDVDPPRELVASDVQTDGATLTWRPPRATISGYTLTSSAADGAVREVMLSPSATAHSLTQLAGSTEHSVRLQAIAGGQRSPYVSTSFTTIGQLYRFPKDCAQALLNGETTSGLYTIYLGGEEERPLQVYCDMSADGGGWIVFLRRQDGKLEFFRNWRNYTAGFGDMKNEFWLGLSNLHSITSSDQYELRVDLRDGNESAYAQYDKFTVAEPRARYKVHVGVYSGTAGDSMSYHQGRPFSTFDKDNDIAVTNCALSYKGAFWYKNCHRVNLMGKYGDNSHSKGINWFHWKGHEHSIAFAEMKIRPLNFRNFESRKKRS